MKKLQKFERTIYGLFVFTNIALVIIAIVSYLTLSRSFNLSSSISILVSGLIWLMGVVVAGARHTQASLRPTSSLYRALDHIAAEPTETAPPKPEAHGISKDIVKQVIEDVYKLGIGKHDSRNKLATAKIFCETILDLESSPIIVLDRNRQIIYANKHSFDVMPKSVDNPIGLTIDVVLSPEITSGISLNQWLTNSQADKIRDHFLWERVRIINDNTEPMYFDMHVDYNKNESHGIETIITLSNKTDTYSADDNQMGLVSMAVHELRSPISLLRGYIELFDEELNDSLTEEQKAFMQKMSITASHMSTFVNNILNISKIEHDQLKTHLQEDTIYDLIDEYREEFILRAQIQNRRLTFNLADGLPSIAIDRLGIYEVLNNLVDNAIKYSKSGGEIIVSAQPQANGGVVVSVQDFGVGIPRSALKNLFQRYYRSHHSKNMVSGTGLGLYLSRVIIEAHGGTISADSEEGKGSTFSFELPSFASNSQSTTDTNSVETDNLARSAHGWIKNHDKIRQ